MAGFIYKIENKINKKKYFGLSTLSSFKERYCRGVENTHNEHLRRSIEKYGIENFEIIEHYDTAPTLEELNQKEKYYIEKYNTTNPKYGYNKSHGGNGIGQHTEEAKKIMSEKGKLRIGEKNGFFGKGHLITGEKNGFYGKKHTDETRKKISELRKGYKHSEEARKKISEAGKKRKQSKEFCELMSNLHKGKVYSEETRKKISENHGFKKEVMAIYENGDVIVFKTVREAIAQTGCHHVTKYTKGYKDHCWETKKIKFYYKEDYLREESM